MTNNDAHYLQLERLQRMEMKDWAVDPMLWLEQRFGEDPKAFKWSMFGEAYDTHQYDGDVDPIYNTWKDIAEGNWAALEACTGSSKTYTLARIVMWYLDTHKDSLVVTSAPKQDQLKLHLWAEIGKIFHKFKRIRPYAELYQLRLVVDARKSKTKHDDDMEGLSHKELEQYSDSWQAVGFVAGVGADEQSATKAQGFHRKYMLIICEETPGMPNAVMTAFKNTSTGEDNLILAVGNPDSQLDPLHQFCELSNVKSYRISAYDYPNVVLGREVFAGAVGKASIDRRRIEYGIESRLYLSRVRGICSTQDKDSLIQLSWIEECIKHELPVNNAFYNAVGVDVAASENGDLAACAYGIGRTLAHVVEFKCPNATHLGYNLIMDSMQLGVKGYTDYNIPQMKDYDIMNGMIGVDSVGVGTATVECLNDNGISPVSLKGGQWNEAIPLDEANENKPLFDFVSLRAQMYWELREDIRQGEIDINITDLEILLRLKRELITARYDTKNGKIRIEKKDEIKKRMGGKSPNLADAIVYWNWTRKGYRMQYGGLPISGGF